MTRSSFVTRAAAALAVVGVSLGIFAGAPASAAPSGPAQQAPARTFLMLAVTPVESPSTVALLTCEPPGGSHPEATAACAALNQAGGDFTKLPGDSRVGACPDVWEPVVASAFGMWKGRLTWYMHRYGNACELQMSTGPVFQVRVSRITDPAEGGDGDTDAATAADAGT